MKNAIIAEASGMIGNLVLEHCLSSPEIAQVTSLVRKKKRTRNILNQRKLLAGILEILKNKDILEFTS